MDKAAAARVLYAAGVIVVPVIANAGDNVMDIFALEAQDAESIGARLQEMRVRSMERQKLGSEDQREFAPQSNTVQDFTQALSNRRPDIVATIKLIDVSGLQPVTKCGVTLCSRFGATHTDQSLRGFLIKTKPMLERGKHSFTIDIITASHDEDLEAEQVLADTLYNIFNDQCQYKSDRWPYTRASKSREEITATDAGRVVARTMPHVSRVKTESKGFRFHSVVVTGVTGAGKSALCCIIGGNEARNSKVFLPVRDGTGTTQVRAKRVKIGSTQVVLVDTPGFGDEHGGDALSTMSMSQQLVGEGKTVAHVHVVKHDEDRPGLVGGDILDKYSDILGRALISRLVVVVTHKNSYNVDVKVDSWREQKVQSSSGEYGSAMAVVELDLREMDWQNLTHPRERELVKAIARPLAMEPVPNQIISDMERWLAKAQQGANQTEVGHARKYYKTRYNAVFAQKRNLLWALGNVSTWRSTTACFIRSGKGLRVFGKRILMSIAIIYEDPLDADEGKRQIRAAKSSLEAIECITKDKVAISYDRVFSECGIRFEAETNYFKLVPEDKLIEVVVKESVETLESRTGSGILRNLVDVATAAHDNLDEW